ncbi:MAG: alkaline shock response membrane anchor protein AmaP [bacterium]|nr:alkaline shock response membrane anchor protein AmaP [bacterium]
MKTLVNILSSIAFFFLSAFCLFLVLWDSEFVIYIALLIERMLDFGWGIALMFTAGFGFLALAMYLLLYALGFEPRLRQHLILSKEDGPIGISLDAVEDFIKRKGRNEPGVRELQVHAEVIDGMLDIDLKMVLELHRNIPDFMREFQQKLNRELKETLGLSNLREVNILIHKILPKENANEPILLVPPPAGKDEDDETDHGMESGNRSTADSS